MSKKMLLCVDCQNDFIDGNLAVSSAPIAMKELAEYIASINKDEYKVVDFTVDWHPFNHSSFTTEGGEWPVHCVQHTNGAAIHNGVFTAVYGCLNAVKNIYTKGDVKLKEEYSIVQNYFSGPKFLRDIDDYEIEEIDVVGICGDVCVLNTIKDLIKMGHKKRINVLTQFCPSLDDGSTLKNFLVENEINFTA